VEIEDWKGETSVVAGCDAMFGFLESAIQTHAPTQGVSVADEVCVGPECDHHCHTLADLTDAQGVDPNDAIWAWASDRLQEPHGAGRRGVLGRTLK
jgi:hypothetical protein